MFSTSKERTGSTFFLRIAKSPHIEKFVANVDLNYNFHIHKKKYAVFMLNDGIPPYIL